MHTTKKPLLLFPLAILYVAIIASCEKTVPAPPTSYRCVDTLGVSASLTPFDIKIDVFRDEFRQPLDLDQDGTMDVEIWIKNNSYGVTGFPDAFGYLIPLNPEYTVNRSPVDVNMCYLYNFPAGEGPDSDRGYWEKVGAQRCNQFSAEELSAVDSVETRDYSDQFVNGYELFADPAEGTTWSTDSTLFFLQSRQGQFSVRPLETARHIALRRTYAGGEEIAWLAIELDLAYHTFGWIRWVAWKKEE